VSVAEPRQEVFLEVAGKNRTCPVCGHDKFWTRKTLLNTRGMTWMGLDWANAEATNFVCAKCSHILWFLSIDESHRADLV
jgi:hypothetical protein